MFTRVSLATIALDPRDGTAVAVLEHAATGAVFPLWLSDDEARAIAGHASSTRESPTGEHLLLGVIRGLGASVREARIVAVVEGIVRADLVLVHGDEERVFAARPSDAIAVALRAGAPIVVDDALLDVVGARVRDAIDLVAPATTAAAEIALQSTAERWNQLISHLSSTRPVRGASDV